MFSSRLFVENDCVLVLGLVVVLKVFGRVQLVLCTFFL